MRRLSTRGPQNGTCNICGAFGKLTEDHTPPKGSVRVTQVEMNNLVELLAAEPPGLRGRVSQNGAKYRTLCKRCNNEKLGLNYDPEFNRFVNAVGAYVNSAIALPKQMSVTAKPHKVARALIGHLMAQRVDGYKKGPNTEDIRDWFLDDQRPMPDYMKIYYWVYPYKTQVLARDATMYNLAAPEPAYFWLMKFFPISFLVIWDTPKGYDYTNLKSFEPFRALGADDEIEIPVDLTGLPHERWPEAPEDGRICAFGSGAIGVVEKSPRRNNR